MANRLKAINLYRPQIALGQTVQAAELARYLADRTGLNQGEVTMMLIELRDALIFFNRAGRGVKLEGLGTYLPNIQLDGGFDVQHRLDPAIKDGLNAPGTFTGVITNRQHIGKTADELVALWNAEHPDDPVA
jgi:hypothetical protein